MTTEPSTQRPSILPLSIPTVVRTVLAAALLATLLMPIDASALRPEEEALVETLAVVDIGTGGIELDDEGNVYTADFGAVLGDPSTAGTSIIKVKQDGSSELFADGFEGASGNAIDSHGNFYQSNIRGGYITRISPDGDISKLVNEGLQAPVGIVIDSNDNLFVANCGSGSIQKVTAEGRSNRFVESELLRCPNGITMDADENLYVAVFYAGDVIKITPQGEVSKLATLPGNNNGHLVYSKGVLYVVARTAHQIYRVSLTGESTLIAGSGERGGQDGAALEASFSFPNDIAATADGKVLYVNESANDSGNPRMLKPTRIRRIMLEP